MNWLTILGIAVGLGMDAFAVAIVAGSLSERLQFRPLFRLSFHFGLFQFMMPIIGWYFGRQVSDYVLSIDHWVAFGLLAAIGGRMVYNSITQGSETKLTRDPTRKWSLVALSIATSIDALAVGLGMAFLRVDIWTPSVAIGIVAAAMTAVGMALGRKLGARFGRRMELLGGIILISIGIKTVIEHVG